eukprot:14849-Rhodomonas_salina.1
MKASSSCARLRCSMWYSTPSTSALNDAEMMFASALAVVHRVPSCVSCSTKKRKKKKKQRKNQAPSQRGGQGPATNHSRVPRSSERVTRDGQRWSRVTTVNRR